MPEWSEVLVILLVAMVVFGPHRLPAMARKAGKMVAEFRVAARELREGIEKELAVEEMREVAKEVVATTKDAGQELRTSLTESEKALRSTPPLAHPTDTKAGSRRSAATADPSDTEPTPGETDQPDKAEPVNVPITEDPIESGSATADETLPEGSSEVPEPDHRP